jgi:hypothetical protein
MPDNDFLFMELAIRLFLENVKSKMPLWYINKQEKGKFLQKAATLSLHLRTLQLMQRCNKDTAQN